MSGNLQQQALSTETVAVVAAPVSARTGKPEEARPADLERQMSVVVVRTLEDLQLHISAWQRLADNALEPNFCYEPWALLPAVEAFGKEEDLRFVFIYAPDPLRPFGEKMLCGFFPLRRSRSYRNLPVATLSLWKHIYCVLCTPLIRKDVAGDCLRLFFDWLQSAGSESKLMEFCHIAADGAFYQLLIDEMNRRAALSHVDERFNRALCKPHSHAPTFVEGISGRHKKELRRKQNRLAEEGKIEFVALEKPEEISHWVEDFLRLEASGWKGSEKSAFASAESDRRFFQSLISGAFANQRLMMLALKLNGEPIAMKLNFVTGRGSFAFKIAFDESYARFSPGVLLEIENMQRFRQMPAVKWMDSCAVAEHFMINRLWTQRRTMETLVVSTGKRFADLTVSVLPLFRWLRRKVSRTTKVQLREPEKDKPQRHGDTETAQRRE